MNQIKSSATGYAQLVEAQSPEPETETDDDRLQSSQKEIKLQKLKQQQQKKQQERPHSQLENSEETTVMTILPLSLDESKQYEDCAVNELTKGLQGHIDEPEKQYDDLNDSTEQYEDCSWRHEAHCGASLASGSFQSNSKLSLTGESSSVRLEMIDTKVAPKRAISKSMLELDTNRDQLGKFEVSWHELSFSYQSRISSTFFKIKPVPVLRELSGSFLSNQLIAAIGPSGCGKTTLLQFLAGNESGLQPSRLRISGLTEPKVAYIGQHDCLLPGLTARETLVFASRLQNTKPGFDHEKHIEPILSALGLFECADRNVNKLSGGQAKRVAIGQELLYPTNLLILDEVTSGLDASSSYSIIRMLKNLVSDRHYPMSIVLSIHQPSARLFSIFDRVYVMSAQGCIYEGSCQVEQINSYLSRFGLECPKFHNVADYLIEIASDEISPEGQAIRDQMIQFQHKQSVDYHSQGSSQQQESHLGLENLSSEANQTTKRRASYEEGVGGQVEGDDERKPLSWQATTKTVQENRASISLFKAIKNARTARPRPILSHLATHLARSLIRIRRSYILTYLQLLTYITLGLQLATFYGPEIGSVGGCPKLPENFINLVLRDDGNSRQDDQAYEMRRIQENMNLLLVAIMTATFAALEITVITFPMEAKTIKREWRNGWYKVPSYSIGRTIAELPYQLAFVMIFSALVYSWTGQIGLVSWRFVSFIIIMVLSAQVAQSVGFIFGAIFMDNLPAAVFSAPLCIFPALLFSGFFSRVSQVPGFYKPLTYLSHFRYAFDALLITLYGYDRCECDQDKLSNYHQNLENQTETALNLFKSLFGAISCESGLNTNENSIEDIPAISTTDLPASVAALLVDLISTTTSSPLRTTLQSLKPLEDALVDSVFDHMNNSANAGGTQFKDEGGVVRIAHKFANKITNMINKRSNFGHEMPTQCRDFNSYLITEFDLHNNDLVFGLLMLFVFVVLSRILCNIILNFTIATRTK